MTSFTHLLIAVGCLLAPALPLLGVEGEKGDKAGKPQVVSLNNANTVQAEFRVGAGGKIGIGLKFADGVKLWPLTGTNSRCSSVAAT